MILSIQHIII